MKKLTVSLAYDVSHGDQRRGGGGIALPVKVLDAEGTVLAERAVSSSQPSVIELPDLTDLAFVRLTWPSSRFETQRVSFGTGPTGSVTFTDTNISPNEWAAWAIPKLNPNTPFVRSGRSDLDLGLRRFDRVWLRLWSFSERTWSRQKVQPEKSYRNNAAWQLDLTLAPRPWLLQIGGSKVVWRFVSLPGGGPARILITPKDSADPRADALKVVVTSFRADAETLLEFLARDAMRAAATLAKSTTLATQLFAEKFSDPVSALAGAYYLLRVDDWQRIPLTWFENLSSFFRWLPDAAIIHCVRLLREGLAADTSRTSARDLFRQSLARGWPVYTEGITLLLEAAALLRQDIGSEERGLLQQTQALGAARAWAGAAASFYGRRPEEPSAMQWVGMPGAPRRARLPPALRTSRTRQPSGRAQSAEPTAPTSAGLPNLPMQASATARQPRDEGEFFLGNIT